MADEVRQETVAGLVVVDAARAAALAIPVTAAATATGAASVAAVAIPVPAAPTAAGAASVTTVATPVTALAVSTPVVPAGTASLAALSHGETLPTSYAAPR